MTTPAWPLPRDTLSPWALNTYRKCPEQFRRKILLGERDATGWPALLGNAVHGALERNFRLKAVTYTDMSMRELEEAYDDAYEKVLERVGGVAEVDWKSGDTILQPSKAKDVARPVARSYHEKISPMVQPLAVEQWIEVRIPGVVPRIVGRVDVMKLNGGKIDFKFGKSARTSPNSDWLLAADIYNLADPTPFEWHTGSWGSERYGPGLHTPVDAPALRYEPGPTNGEITTRVIQAAAASIVALYNTFGPDEPWPDARSHQWACNYCSYREDGSCVYWPAPVPKPAVQLNLAESLL